MIAIKEHIASIVTTTSYFENYLYKVDSKLRTLLQRVRILGEDNDDYEEFDRLREDKESIEQCLKICAKASRNVNHRL
jgi:hypothetical protein